MPRANTCPRCGRPSLTGNSFCPACGSKLPQTPTAGGKGWKLFLGAFAVFVGLLWLAVLFVRTVPTPQLTTASRPQALTGSVNGAAQTAPPTPTAPLTLTSTQHLAEAKRALAQGYKPDKDLRKARWGEVAEAKQHLDAIGATEPEYREAQALLKEVVRRERQIELAAKQAERDEDAEEEAATTARTSSSASSSPANSGAGATGSGSSSEYYTNSRGEQVPRPRRSENGPPPGATAQCGDGSYSFSQSRRGTCSHHGGVSRWL